MMKQGKIWAALTAILVLAGALSAQSLDIPSRRWGISFGNSKNFTGLRFNFRDSEVEHIRGINITLWQPREKENEDAIVDGFSFGLIPGGGTLRGVQVGLLGVAGVKNVYGITLGLLGGGSGGSIKGINIGGLGMGAGEDIVGINIGGLGVGAGGDMIGLNIGGLGVGAGGNLTGINISALGAGAGESLSGLTFVGLAAGAPKVRGLIAAGLAAGGQDVRGVLLAGAFTTVPEGGEIHGLAASPVNWYKGSQTGLSIGIVNYARSLKGLQIGLVNIVRDNPPGLKVLPVFNAGF